MAYAHMIVSAITNDTIFKTSLASNILRHLPKGLVIPGSLTRVCYRVGSARLLTSFGLPAQLRYLSRGRGFFTPIKGGREWRRFEYSAVGLSR